MSTERTSLREFGAALFHLRRPWYARMKPEEAGEWRDVADALRDISRFDAVILAASDYSPSKPTR
jgi:hypothetical protein